MIARFYTHAIAVAALAFNIASSQQLGFQYISPVPGSILVPCQTTIAIRKGPRIISPGVADPSPIRINGSSSGQVAGRLSLSDDGRTLIIKPEHPFSPGELVSVELSGGLLTDEKGSVGTLHFSFRTRPEERNIPWSFAGNEETGIAAPPRSRASVGAEMMKTVTDSLPPGFPQIMDTVASSYPNVDLYLSNFAFSPTIPYVPYLMILSPNGQLRFYRRMMAQCLDFKWQPTGLMTYFDASIRCYLAMDSTFTVVDTFSCGNGYSTDVHDLRLLPDGHALLMSYDPEPVRMDSVVPGGYPNAIVTGLIVQELDKDKNVIFQWRSWDHFAITDAEGIDLHAPAIDYVHGNALEIDTDGNFIISSRYLSEITKVDRNSGNIIWRWGGKHNQFSFVNDSTMFSYQHAIRRITNGHFVLFDNGNLRVPPYSRAIEYSLDENAKTATMVWGYRHNPDISSDAMGYVDRLPDGSTLVGWGAANPSLTIVGSDNTTLAELSFPPGIYSYRAFAFPPLPEKLTSGPTAGTPSSFALWQNYPNPFNPSTTILYQLPTQSRVSLIVCDILGQQVATLVDSDQQAGAHSVQWNAKGQASGVYFCRIVAGNNTETKKMLLVR